MLLASGLEVRLEAIKYLTNLLGFPQLLACVRKWLISSEDSATIRAMSQVQYIFLDDGVMNDNRLRGPQMGEAGG
jgi:hypothetical protein